MVENFVRRLEDSDGSGRDQLMEKAVHEVSRPIVFGVAIIIAVYLPIFTLQGLEGRMFRPMAITVCSALAGSLLLALFAVPTVGSLVVKYRKHGTVQNGSEGWFGRVRRAYRTSLAWSFRH